MAGQRKDHIDKDFNLNDREDAETKTAHHNQAEIEGPQTPIADRNGNGDTHFKGVTKTGQGRRKADQYTKGSSGDMGPGLQAAESVSPFQKILDARFGGLAESENPGVASSSATSDNPSMGMYSVNSSDFKQSDVNVKNMLESIALQAAEAFETIQENNTIPNALASELDQCTKVLARLYEYVKSNQRNDPQTGTAPVENDPATSAIRREEAEMGEDLYCIRAESFSGESFESEEMTKEEAEAAVEEMYDSASYYRVEMHLSSKQKAIAGIAGDKDKIDAKDLKTLRAKRKMHEAVEGLMSHILRSGE